MSALDLGLFLGVWLTESLGRQLLKGRGGQEGWISFKKETLKVQTGLLHVPKDKPMGKTDLAELQGCCEATEGEN